MCSINMETVPFNLKDFDLIISLGDNCAPSLALRDLGLHHETYPYDWIRSTTQIIYDSLLDDFEKYTKFDEESEDYHLSQMYSKDYPNFPSNHINSYGQYFTHYLNYPPKILTEIFKRRGKRLKDCLKLDKKFLFVRSTESYVYDKKSRDNADIYWDYLKKISSFLETTYPELDFTILNIETNIQRDSEGRICNMCLDIPRTQDIYDNGRCKDLYTTYRRKIFLLLKGLK